MGIMNIEKQLRIILCGFRDKYYFFMVLTFEK